MGYARRGVAVLFLCCAALPGASGGVLSWLLNGGGDEAAVPVQGEGSCTEADPTFTRLVQWVSANGGDVAAKIELFDSGSGRGRGLRVASGAKVAAGERLAFIPDAVVVHGGAGEDGKEAERVAARLLALRREGDVFYEPYFSTLPEKVDVGVWLPDDLTCVSGNPAVDHLTRAAASHKEAVDRLVAAGHGDLPTVLGAFRLAKTRLTSLYVGLIPVADLVNHGASPNAEVVRVKGGFALKAVKAATGGEEVLIRYPGADVLTSAGYLNGYGFLDPGDASVSVKGVSGEVQRRYGCRPRVAPSGEINGKWVQCVAVATLPKFRAKVEAAAGAAGGYPAALAAKFRTDARQAALRRAMYMLDDSFHTGFHDRAPSPSADASCPAAAPVAALYDVIAAAYRNTRKAMVARIVKVDAQIRKAAVKEVGAPDARFAALVAWVEANGGRVNPKVAMAYGEGVGNHLIAAGGAIDVHEELFFLPPEVSITPEARASGAEGTAESRAVETALLTAAALSEGASGFYAPYIPFLAHGVFGPRQHTPAARRCLAALSSNAADKYAAAGRQVAQLVARGVDEATAALAVDVVESRSLDLKGYPALHPVFDLMNHGNNGSVGRVHPPVSSGHFFLASRALKKGEQIWYEYKDEPSTPDTFLFSYGFLDPETVGMAIHVSDAPLPAGLRCQAPDVYLQRSGTASPRLQECTLASLLQAQQPGLVAQFAAMEPEQRAREVSQNLPAVNHALGPMYDQLRRRVEDAAGACDADALAETPFGRDVARLQTLFTEMFENAVAGTGYERSSAPAARPAATTPPPEDLEIEAAFSRLKEWVAARGGRVHDSVTVATDSRRGRHLRVGKGVAAGAELASVGLVDALDAERTLGSLARDGRYFLAAAGALARVAKAGSAAAFTDMLPDAVRSMFDMPDDARQCYKTLFSVTLQSKGQEADAIVRAASKLDVPLELLKRMLDAVRNRGLIGGYPAAAVPVVGLVAHCSREAATVEVRVDAAGARLVSSRELAAGSVLCRPVNSGSPAEIYTEHGPLSIDTDAPFVFHNLRRSLPENATMTCDNDVGAALGADGSIPDAALYCFTVASNPQIASMDPTARALLLLQHRASAITALRDANKASMRTLETASCTVRDPGFAGDMAALVQHYVATYRKVEVWSDAELTRLATGRFPTSRRRAGELASAFRDVASWAAERGGRVHAGMQLFDTESERGLGVRLGEGVAAGMELAFIPDALIVGAGDTRAGVRVAAARGLLDVLAERRDAYMPYLRTLPSVNDLPSTPCAPQIAERTMQSDIAELFKANAGLTYDDARRALRIASSRASGWGGAEEVHGLVPIYDLVNHNLTKRNVRLERRDGGAALVATAPVAAGEELFVAYADPASAAVISNDFFVSYGFPDADAAPFVSILIESAGNLDHLGCASNPPVDARVTDRVPFIVWECLGASKYQWARQPGSTTAGRKALFHGTNYHFVASTTRAFLQGMVERAARDVDRCSDTEVGKQHVHVEAQQIQAVLEAFEVEAARVAAEVATEHARLRAAWPDTPLTRNYSAVVDWVIAKGGRVNPKYLAHYSPEKGYHMIAQPGVDILKHEELGYFPENATIHGSNVQRAALAAVEAWSDPERAEYFAPYLALLPRDPFLSTDLTDAEEACLASDTPGKVRLLQRHLLEKGADEAAAKTATSLAISRMVGDGSMVPIFDMFNHDSRVTHVTHVVSQDTDTKAWMMSTVRHVTGGEEMFFNYGQGHPASFFANYGFHDYSREFLPIEVVLPFSNSRNLNAQPLDCSMLRGTSCVYVNGTLSTAFFECQYAKSLTTQAEFDAFVELPPTDRAAAVPAASRVAALREQRARVSTELAELAKRPCGEELGATFNGREVLKVHKFLLGIYEAAARWIDAEMAGR